MRTAGERMPGDDEVPLKSLEPIRSLDEDLSSENRAELLANSVDLRPVCANDADARAFNPSLLIWRYEGRTSLEEAKYETADRRSHLVVRGDGHSSRKFQH
jgi:hypothetical protein